MTRLRTRSPGLSLHAITRNLRPVLALVIVLSVLSLLTYRAFFGYVVRSYGDTMAPDIPADSWLWVSFDVAESGDIVLVEGDENRVLRRVIGTSGDTVTIDGDRIYLNGERVQWTEKSPGSVSPTPLDATRPPSGDTVQVPEGSLFLHCNQVWLCRDAQHTGLVDLDMVVGPVSGF